MVGASLLSTVLVGMSGTAGTVTAQSGAEPFVDVAGAAVDQARDAPGSTVVLQPDESRSLLLNRDAMATALAGAPAEGSGSVTLELPAPDGSTERFAVWKTAVMAPELAARFPEIATYGGQGLDDGAATIVADLTPHGFHAQVSVPERQLVHRPRGAPRR